MTSGTEYEFTLTVTAAGFDQGTDSTKIIFELGSASFLKTLHIANFDSSFQDSVIPNRDTIFEAFLDPANYADLVFSWSVTGITNPETAYINGQNFPSLKVAAFTFQPNQSYTVKLELTKGSNTMKAERTFTVHEEPQGGKLEIDPATGTALEQYTLTTSEWTSSFLPL